MLLKANKYRKDKKADCRQNELGSRIFMGRVFGDYAECLHFYPSFSYGRIIAGEMVETSRMIVDGKEVPVERILKNGTNYVKIRDVAAALGLEVGNQGNVAVLRRKES